MTDMTWKLVPVSPTPEMITAAVGLKEENYGYSNIAAKCVRDWNDMLKAAPASPVLEGKLSGKAVTVEQLAKYLFENDDPDADELTWPDDDDDEGYRGDGGWVKLVSPIVADEYRDKARGILHFMGCEVNR